VKAESIRPGDASTAHAAQRNQGSRGVSGSSGEPHQLSVDHLDLARTFQHGGIRRQQPDGTCAIDDSKGSPESVLLLAEKHGT
jgi:hypothetical protein